MNSLSVLGTVQGPVDKRCKLAGLVFGVTERCHWAVSCVLGARQAGAAGLGPGVLSALVWYTKRPALARLGSLVSCAQRPSYGAECIRRCAESACRCHVSTSTLSARRKVCKRSSHGLLAAFVWSAVWGRGVLVLGELRNVS